MSQEQIKEYWTHYYPDIPMPEIMVYFLSHGDFEKAYTRFCTLIGPERTRLGQLGEHGLMEGVQDGFCISEGIGDEPPHEFTIIIDESASNTDIILQHEINHVKENLKRGSW
jgi:hypothetical protein